jgi:hypothetical protein
LDLGPIILAFIIRNGRRDLDWADTKRKTLSIAVTLPQPFDLHYMNELFKVGYDLGKSGYDWAKLPPGY